MGYPAERDLAEEMEYAEEYAPIMMGYEEEMEPAEMEPAEKYAPMMDAERMEQWSWRDDDGRWKFS